MTAKAQITVNVNGQPRELADEATVASMLSELQIDVRRIAVELNGVVVRRLKHDTTRLHDGDAVEIVTFVGGG